MVWIGKWSKERQTRSFNGKVMVMPKKMKCWGKGSNSLDCWIHGVLAQQQESRHVRGDVRGGGRHCPVGLGRRTLRHTSSNGAHI